MTTRIHSKAQSFGILASLTGCAIAAAFLTGCGQGQGDASSTRPSESRASLPNGFFLSSVPGGGVAVSELKSSAEDGDEVVVRTVVGGRKSPIAEGRAVWTGVDAGLTNACTRSGHGCPEPWDYCCANPDELARNTATLRVVDEQGVPLAVDLASSGPIAPMATLVVTGTVAPRPNPQTLVIDVKSVFVESER